MPALHDIVKKGSTDRSVTVFIADSTAGTPETGVVWNTSGIDLWYRREGAAKVAITEATLAALTTAHSDGGFLHIADGVYRLDLPDAAFATGAEYVDFGGTVTGMVVYGGRVRLVNVDVEDGVRAGLTALPNAAADAAGGLTISDTGGVDMDAMATSVAAIEVDTGTSIPALLPAALVGGRIDASVGAMAANTVTASALAADAVAEIADGVFDEATAGHVTAGTYGVAITDILADTNEMQGDLANGGRLDTIFDSILADTGELQTDWTDGGRLDLIIDAILDDTDLIDDATSGLAKIATDAAAILVDTGTSIPALLPAALVGGKIDANVGAISGDTVAADRLEALMDTIVVAQVNDAGATTTAFIADGFTEATADHFIGRLVTFMTGALATQQTNITDYDGATQTFTVTAMTEAPANDDFFVIT